MNRMNHPLLLIKILQGESLQIKLHDPLTKSESVIIRLSGTICIAEEEEEGRNPSLLFTPRKSLLIHRSLVLRSFYVRNH